MRQRRAKEERKRERHIDEVNDRQIGKIRERSSNIDVMSTQHFPTVCWVFIYFFFLIILNFFFSQVLQLGCIANQL